MRTIESKNFNISETGATILNAAVKGTIVAKRFPLFTFIFWNLLRLESQIL